MVTADDFGNSFGLNRGIIEAHTKGIVTNTSVMVDGLASGEAKDLSKYRKLSVGLHFDIFDKVLREKVIEEVVLPLTKVEKIKKEFNRQIDKFIKITGKKPDYLDSHHHVHFYRDVRPIFEKYSQKNKIPARAYGKVNFIDSFYGGDKLGEKGLKDNSVEAMIKILANLKEGVNEIMSHPGYIDDHLKKLSSHLEEREEDLATLTNKRVSDYIKKSAIKLCGWKEISFEKIYSLS